MKILLITPPFTQLNTPYPATAYLKALLAGEGYDVSQIDLGNRTIGKVFSREGLQRIYNELEMNRVKGRQADLDRFISLKTLYLATIDPVVSFLRGDNDQTAYRINSGQWLPEGERQESEKDNSEYLPARSLQDRARHKATLYLEEIGDIITSYCDGNFGFSRYAEKLALSPPEFNRMEEELAKEPSLISRMALEALDDILRESAPDLCCFTIPFPGNLFGALSAGKFIKDNFPSVKIAMGGGYVNTELRTLKDRRLFNFTDFITLDDGEKPLLKICRYLSGELDKNDLLRTFIPGSADQVEYIAGCDSDYSPDDLPAPDYDGLMDQPYLSLLPVDNPMHRLWSDGKWLKMTLAHGCYWHRCAFCDTSLDYICRYEASTASVVVDKMEEMIGKTGINSFHFVDEAAPPALLKEMAIELLRREMAVSWWTNIRFEKSFTPDLCRLLAKSGCIAVSGGLEVASDRLLDKIDKGVTVSQVASVAGAFSSSGIMVHAYLMYGFPGQREGEIIDALENVRQLFEEGLIDSAFWHQFALTAHSPAGLYPDRFGIEITGPPSGGFARNDLEYRGSDGFDPSDYSPGLRAALYAYMSGFGTGEPVRKWFGFKTPRPTVHRNFIRNLMNDQRRLREIDEKTRFLWTGAEILWQEEGFIEFHDIDGAERIKAEKNEWIFLSELLKICNIKGRKTVRLDDIESLCRTHNRDIDSFLDSDLFQTLWSYGLLML